MLRDKRVINGAFIMPIFLIVLLMILFGFLQETLTKPKPPRIGVVDSAIARAQVPRLFPNSIPEFVPDRATGEKRLLDGQVKLVLIFAPDFDTRLKKGGAQVTAVYDQSATMSELALAQVTKGVAEVNAKRLGEVLTRAKVEPSAVEAIRLVPEKPTSQKGKGDRPEMLVQLLPYLIVIWAFYGGFSTVADMVAGEKERGTMETLLISPAARTQIALGKFFALALVCLASSLMSLVGLIVIRLIDLPITRGITKDIQALTPEALAAILLVLVPLVLFFSGLLLAVSAASRNMREAQTYLTLVSFVVLMPAMFSQFLGFTDLGTQTWVRYTPILDAALAIREALLARTDWSLVGITAAIGIGLAVAMLAIVGWLFRREQILTRV